MNNQRRRHVEHIPHFEAGVLSEPTLLFGGRHEHVDPKTGLSLYGPYTIAGQDRPSLSNITVGIVGPKSMISDAEHWLALCQNRVTNDGSQPFLYPAFPGFNEAHPFQCELIFGDTWRETLDDKQLSWALDTANFYERIKRVAKLYIEAMEPLTIREPKPHVILCCIPQTVIDFCTVRVAKSGDVKRRKISKAERYAVEMARRGQLSLLQDMDPYDEGEHQNLRRAIKALAMQFDIPTQLVWPRTLSTTSIMREAKERPLQDIATRAWNFTTALYHKAGGSPWRLAPIETGVCFVGISFYREIGELNPRMRTSMAEAFTATGDGYVLRGNPFEWDNHVSPSPHLDAASAAALMRDVLDLYKKQNRGSLPARLVVHKSSRFWDEELAGFESATNMVPRKDFVALGKRDIQFYRTGDYPPLRGSYVKFSDENLLLYTTGYIPYLRTYPGARVPQPLEILEHYGNSPWMDVLKEILILTKMNWNTADFATGKPITTAFSQRVGQILAELPLNMPLRSEYRYYM